MTVTETLQFARSCRNPLDAALAGKSGPEIERMRELDEKRLSNTIGFLGLTRAKDTIIGNDVMKGVSGGEKRRVTLGASTRSTEIASDCF